MYFLEPSLEQMLLGPTVREIERLEYLIAFAREELDREHFREQLRIRREQFRELSKSIVDIKAERKLKPPKIRKWFQFF